MDRPLDKISPNGYLVMGRQDKKRSAPHPHFDRNNDEWWSARMRIDLFVERDVTESSRV